MSFNLADIRIGHPKRFESLSTFPLFSKRIGRVEYLLSDEAIESELLSVSEVSDQGSVSDLLVENNSETRVLFLEGEELVGAKQNRILNTSILVGAKTTIRVPVTCVEHGRWWYRNRGCSSSRRHSPSAVRFAVKSGVSESLAARRMHRADQTRVWEEVAEYDAAFNVGSPTGSLSDIFDALAHRAADARQSLPYVEGATGVAIALGPKVVAVELFDKPATCRKVWGRLLAGFMLDALVDQPGEQLANQADVERLINATRHAKWDTVNPVGDGEEFRANIVADYASALCLNHQLLHGSVISRGKHAA